ncbi:MAG: glycerophosphodiester phosphodiesterase family protein [Weeksellaceae bacterium]
MKNIQVLTLILFTFFYSCKNAPEILSSGQVDSTEITSAIFNSPTETLISAHRGGSGLKGYPENAIETLEYLYQKDIKIFEIDIIQTKDNQLMLLHDDFLERTTTGQGKIKNFTADDLLKYNLVDDFGNSTDYKIPYLKDVFQWAQNKDVYLMIDFKKSVKYEKVIDLIQEYSLLNKCVLISYNVQQAEKLHKLSPESLLSVSARNMQELDWMLNTKIPTEKMVAFTGTKLSSDELYKKLNELKIPAILGTLGNLDKRAAARGDHLYKTWKDLGIQIIATDRPLEAYNALK